MIDYRVYRLSGKERRDYYIAACLVLATLGFLFYRSLIMGLLCSAIAIPCEKFYALILGERRRARLLEGFRDVLYSISASVAAGRQMPQAIEDCALQMELSYGKEADIVREMSAIAQHYREMHGDASAMLCYLGERSGIAEISQFANSYRICERSGGDLEEVCLRSANLLLDKIAFAGEVKAIIAQKKLDIGMLVSLPLIILLFLNLTAPDYTAPLYTTISGRLIMTLCLGGIGFSLWLSLKITKIKL